MRNRSLLARRRAARLLTLTVLASAMTLGPRAQAQAPTGAPPADAKVLVDAPKAGEAAPKLESPTDETTASVSAGGQMATGNSQLAASTVNGKFEMRRGSDGFGASLLGNYGETALPKEDLHVTTENLQGRVRYDRYLIERLSLFGIATGRHDRFQGLDFRLNLDPGAKYLFVLTDPTQFWGEAGYDFQYDVRRDEARFQLDPAGNPDPTQPLLDKTATDHSGRLFVGVKHAFNKEVNLSSGIEFLQSFKDSSHYRLNYDVLFAANVSGGLALGVGFTARYDNAPLPGKKDLDSATTLSLIYSFSDVPEAAPATPPPCVAAPPPPPPPPPVDVPPATTAPPPAAPPPTAPPANPQ